MPSQLNGTGVPEKIFPVKCTQAWNLAIFLGGRFAAAQSSLSFKPNPSSLLLGGWGLAALSLVWVVGKHASGFYNAL